MTIRRIVAGITVLLLAGAGCADENPAAARTAPGPVATPAPPTTTPSTTPAPPNAPPVAPAADGIAAADATFGRILADIVTADGLVRYELLDDPARRSALQTVVERYAQAATPAGRDERMALWCNAYNANVLLQVDAARRKPGFDTVVNVPGFFDATKITVAGESLTLNDLENERIRPLGDARIHAALVCAAMSCPPLRAEPFTASRLDAQLEDQCKRWINDEGKFRIVDGQLGLSRILDWYGADFQGAKHGGPAGFVRTYATPSGTVGRYLATADPVRTTWIEYDWTLNQAK